MSVEYRLSYNSVCNQHELVGSSLDTTLGSSVYKCSILKQSEGVDNKVWREFSHLNLLMHIPKQVSHKELASASIPETKMMFFIYLSTVLQLMLDVIHNSTGEDVDRCTKTCSKPHTFYLHTHNFIDIVSKYELYHQFASIKSIDININYKNKTITKNVINDDIINTCCV